VDVIRSGKWVPKRNGITGLFARMKLLLLVGSERIEYRKFCLPVVKKNTL
jgi:hypothetical protein